MQEPNTPGFWAVSLLWVKKNAPAIYGGMTAFGIAFFLAIRDREFWKQALTSGILCMLIAISVISALDQLGKAKKAAEQKAGQPFGCTFHDIKAKSISDYSGSSRDKQLFSGHKTESQVLVYDRKVKITPSLNAPLLEKQA